MDDKKLADWEKLRGPILEQEDVSKDDASRADYHCYRNDQGHCYIPSDQYEAH
jgi:hypothetical protein